METLKMLLVILVTVKYVSASADKLFERQIPQQSSLSFFLATPFNIDNHTLCTRALERMESWTQATLSVRGKAAVSKGPAPSTILESSLAAGTSWSFGSHQQSEKENHIDD